jgi:GNAT superfamily N-acetyltransferase
MIEQRIYPASKFPIVLEWQVRDFVRIVWSDAHVDQPTVPLGDPDRNPMNFVIVDGDMLISHAQVTTFSIEHVGKIYRVAGLGGVMTYPNFRKEGYGKQLIEAVTQYIANSDVDFGMLFTAPALEGFYKQHGWLAIATKAILVGEKSAPRQRNEFTMILPVSANGQQALQAFQGAEVYVGTHGW